MTAVVVQQFKGADLSSTSLVWGGNANYPTAGNLLVVFAGNRFSVNWGVPLGWTLLWKKEPWDNSSSTRSYCWAKIATGSENNVTFAATTGRPAFWGVEIDGDFLSLSGLEILEHAGNAESTTLEGQYGLRPGTSGTLSVYDAFCLTATFWRGGLVEDNPTSGSVDDGYTAGLPISYDGASDYPVSIIPAWKDVNYSNNATNPLVTWLAANGKNYVQSIGLSVLIVLKKSIDTTPSPEPVVEVYPESQKDLVIRLFDKYLRNIAWIEEIKSVSWSVRFNEVSTCEVILPSELITKNYEPTKNPEGFVITTDMFMTIGQVGRIMLIQEVRTVETEKGGEIVITGEDALTLLKRRSVQLTNVNAIDAGPNQWIHDFFNDHFGPTAGLDRTMMPPFMDESTVLVPDTKTFTLQWNGTYNVYDLVTAIAKASETGIRVYMSAPYRDTIEFIFRAYEGNDRTIGNAFDNTPVIFGGVLDNVKTIDSVETTRQYVNIVQVLTNDVTYPEVWVYGLKPGVLSVEPSGISRYEETIVYNIDRNKPGGGTLTNAEVSDMIARKGRELLNQKKRRVLYEVEITTDDIFRYGTHYTVGDLVTVVVDAEVKKARVVEMVYTASASDIRQTVVLDLNLADV